jgi:hypothetical protein
MNKTLDTTAIIKGVLEPRRKKQDAIFKEQWRVHRIASSILEDIYNKNDSLFIPMIALVETAAVASRLTGDKDLGKKNADFIKSISRIVSENELVDEAISIAADTKISGFDSTFIACAKITNSMLITDDKKMHQAAVKAGIKSKLLREMSI